LRIADLRAIASFLKSEIRNPQSEIPLPTFSAPVGFFNHGAITATAETKSGVHVTLCRNAGTARWDAPSGDNPDAAGPVVNLVGTIAQNSIAVRYAANDTYFFVAEASRVSVDSGNVLLLGASRQKQRCGEKKRYDTNSFRQMHRRLLFGFKF